MSNKLKVIPRVTRLANYLEEMERGKLVPLQFRDFVWTKEQCAGLFDSLQKGYPIGSLLLWQPNDSSFPKENYSIGPYKISPNKNGVFYIIDGFQRMTALFSYLTNPSTTDLKIGKDNTHEFNLYYDLINEKFIFSDKNTNEITLLPVNILANTFELLSYFEKLTDQLGDNSQTKRLTDKVRNLASTIFDYQLPIIQIYGGNIDDVKMVFSRINTEGSPLKQSILKSAVFD